jgi:hypothetical protein
MEDPTELFASYVKEALSVIPDERLVHALESGIHRNTEHLQKWMYRLCSGRRRCHHDSQPQA